MNFQKLVLSVILFFCITSLFGQQNRGPIIGYIPIDSISLSIEQKTKISYIAKNPVHCFVNFVSWGNIQEIQENGKFIMEIPDNQNQCRSTFNTGPSGEGTISGGTTINYPNSCSRNYDHLNSVDTTIADNLIPYSITKDIYWSLHSIEYESDSSYYYHAKIDTCATPEDFGSMYFRVKDGKKFGKVYYNDEYYKFYDLGNDVQIIIKMLKDKSCVPCDVGTIKENYFKNKTNEKIDRMMSCTNLTGCTVDLMTFYTDKAEMAGFPIQTAWMFMDELQEGLNNSKLDLGFNMLDIRRLESVDEQGLSPGALHSLVSNNPEYMAALNEVGPDLSLIYVESDNFENLEGWANIAFAGIPGLASIFFTDITTTFDYVESHEMAHLFGCQHADGIFSGMVTTSNQGFNFFDFSFAYIISKGIFSSLPTGNYQTVVEHGPDLSDEDYKGIINYFSNPKARWRGKKAGSSSANNSSVLETHHCCISEYKEPSDFEVTGYIDGPPWVQVGDSEEWCLDLQNCPNLVSVKWEYSLDGFTYLPLPSFNDQECVTFNVTSPDHVFFRVNVQCESAIGTPSGTILFIRVENIDHTNDDCDPEMPSPIVAGNPSENESTETIKIIIEGNPVGNQLTALIQSSNEFNVNNIKIFNSVGDLMIKQNYYVKDIREFQLDVTRLAPGIYNLFIEFESIEKSIKFVKS